MEYTIFTIVIILFLVVFYVNGYLGNRKKEAWFRQKLKEQYGSRASKEYDLVQFESISHYFKKRNKEGFFIDDITWNDLDMDRIFKAMNHTYSSAGEEYLYYTLRNVKTEVQSLEELEKLITYFSENEKERVDMQVDFWHLGKTGQFSLSDYFDYLGDLGKRSNVKHYVVNILILLSIMCVPFATGIATIITLSLLGYNVANYFREKGDITPYITSFSYLLRLFKAAEKIERKQIKELDKYNKILNENQKAVAKLKKRSFWAMGIQKGTTSLDVIEIIMDYVRMFFHIDLIKFNNMLMEMNAHKKEIEAMLQVVGLLETSIAIGAFRASIPYYCKPDFIELKEVNVKEGYHPLVENAVSNSIFAKQGVLLTGSNASGKSTFLKTIALNVLLAQTIHTTLAKTYEAGIFRLFSSMSLRDSIESGESYYMVEIKAIKRILDETKKENVPVICFVDEVLRGTNTVERIAASTEILKSLENERVLCFAATHDIELTYLLEGYENYHFTEEIAKGDVLFSYELMTGKATSRNAIQLLKLMGYEDSIVESASNRAIVFFEEGEWKV